MQRFALSLFGLAVALCLPLSARADVLRLSNGRSIEGIIVRRTESQIKIQVAKDGYVGIPHEQVVAVTEGTEKKHEGLISQWHAEYKESQERERAQEAFQLTQLARGLVLYKGGWISQSELIRIDELQSLKKELKAQREGTEQARRELASLTQEVRRLRDELAQERTQLRSRVIFRHPFPSPHPHDSFAKDKHGNLLRLRRSDGEKFFVSPDGRHVSLAQHNDHLAFADTEGEHQDLTHTFH